MASSSSRSMVVAQAVWGLAKALTPDRERAGIALVAVFLVVFVGGSIDQVASIVIGGLLACGFAADSR